MNERVVEILIYIMSQIRRNSSYSNKLDLLSKNLIRKGYTESEISSALTWLLSRLRHDSEETLQKGGTPTKQSFRHLHEIERSVITTEAYGYIIQLKELGIIDEFDVEQILERALMLGTSEITVEDIKSIVASFLFNSDGFPDGPYYFFDEDSIIH
ncbi:MAG: DUF494 family protein [Calditrichaeota bacterium]|nr:MAG: DUF494 family protein [Calditrichota bacterium]